MARSQLRLKVYTPLWLREYVKVIYGLCYFMSYFGFEIEPDYDKICRLISNNVKVKKI